MVWRRTASHASGKSSPKISVNCATSSTTTGVCSGPELAKPTNTATSMRGSTSVSGGDWTSKRKPGKRRGRSTTMRHRKISTSKLLFHLKPFVREREFFHRHVGALRVHRAADVFDDA